MNKKDFRDGDVVSFLDTPYNRGQDILKMKGTVVDPDFLGLLVRLDGVFYLNTEGEKLQKYVYYRANQIECVKVE